MAEDLTSTPEPTSDLPVPGAPTMDDQISRLDDRDLRWQISRDGRRSHTVWMVAFATYVLLFIFGGLAGLFFGVGTLPHGLGYLFATLAGVCLIVTVLGILYRLDARRRWYIADEARARQLSVEAAAAEIEQRSDVTLSGPEFATFWRETYTRLNSYHTEAGDQLHSAYLLAQIAAGLGFVTLLVLGIVAGFAASSVQSIVAGAAATVGAALAAFISKTFQTTYSQALRQRMTYFDEPVVMARLLAAERLVQQLEGAPRSEALLTMVRAAVMEPSASVESGSGVSQTAVDGSTT
jgi:hypothetical protein